MSGSPQDLPPQDSPLVPDLTVAPVDEAAEPLNADAAGDSVAVPPDLLDDGS